MNEQEALRISASITREQLKDWFTELQCRDCKRWFNSPYLYPKAKLERDIPYLISAAQDERLHGDKAILALRFHAKQIPWIENILIALEL